MIVSARVLAGALVAALGFLPAAHAGEDAFPKRPIRVVVPYAAGGGADAAARLIGKRMNELLGQPVLIDNKGGAGGSIGEGAVAVAKPDGYTMLFTAAAFTINPHIHRLPFKISQLQPVSQSVVMPDLVVVAANSPYRTFQELVDAARDKANRITYASYGIGSTAHMLGELMNLEGNLEMTHVPYKGGAPALVDVMAGRVTTYFASVASSLAHVQGGSLRALAVTSPERLPDLPDVPTLRELGYPTLETMEWNGFFVPAGTPEPIRDVLEKATREAVMAPEVQAGLKKLGLTPVARSSDEFEKIVNSDLEKWGKVVKRAKLAQR